MRKLLGLLVLWLTLALVIPALPVSANAEIMSFEVYTINIANHPDDVGGAFFTGNNLCLMVLNPTTARNEQLRTQYGAKYAVSLDQITIIPCKYSYNELVRTSYEIYVILSSSDNQPWAIGISENTNCVEISVAEQSYAYYFLSFSQQYGDKVHVRINTPFIAEYGLSSSDQFTSNTTVLSPNTIAQSSRDIPPAEYPGNNTQNYPMPNSSLLIPWVMGVSIIAALSFLYWRDARPVRALNTARGTISSALVLSSRQQTIMAVKNSVEQPSHNLYRSIIEDIDKREKFSSYNDQKP
ncbi:MAG: hypothetical protein FWH42_00190 [Dehalococcoidia bacterium]|nr:hypothetical protein [Dehalococcoidia bacterium]